MGWGGGSVTESFSGGVKALVLILWERGVEGRRRSRRRRRKRRLNGYSQFLDLFCGELAANLALDLGALLEF
jgi:hypothetical protein